MVMTICIFLNFGAEFCYPQNLVYFGFYKTSCQIFDFIHTALKFLPDLCPYTYQYYVRHVTCNKLFIFSNGPKPLIRIMLYSFSPNIFVGQFVQWIDGEGPQEDLYECIAKWRNCQDMFPDGTAN